MESILVHAINVIIGIVIATIWQKIRKQKEEQDAIKVGLQSLLRNEIIKGYNLYVVDKGWMPIFAHDGLEACYKSYETLGANGVIDNLWEELQGLPHHQPNKNEDLEVK